MLSVVINGHLATLILPQKMATTTTAWTFQRSPHDVMVQAGRYFASLTPADLSARSAGSQLSSEVYHQRYQEALLQNLSPTEVAVIGRSVSRAQDAIDRFGTRNIFDKKRLAAIPWKIAVLSSAQSHSPEGGWPHTFGDIIVLPQGILHDNVDDLTLPRTLVHEKIHVYQRMYPAETHILYTRVWGMRLEMPGIPHETRDLDRSNPDISPMVYVAPHHGKYIHCSQVYNRASPRDLSDSRVLCRVSGQEPQSSAPTQDLTKYEHPNEAMAYILADIIFDSDSVSAQSKEHAWMVRYL